MIVKRNFSPVRVLGYVWRPMGYVLVVSLSVVAVAGWTGREPLVLPFAPVATLGAAVAIFVAFRNNASYARWWEARTLWGNIVANSRILARQLIAATDNAMTTAVPIAAGPVAAAGGEAAPLDRSLILAYRHEVVLRIVAFAHALRIELRGGSDWEVAVRLLPAVEFEQLRYAHNRPNLLLQTMAVRIKDGVRAGMVGPFDPITLEPQLAALSTWAARCERIKTTPTPRQYDYFTRSAVAVFSTALPFALLGMVEAARSWLVVVLSLIVAGVFVILERVGAIVEAPFADAVTDIPMTSITTAMERDLREQLGELSLPPAVQAVDGYLW